MNWRTVLQDDLFELFQPPAAVGLDGDHRHAQVPAQTLDVHPEPISLGDVDPVEGHDHGHAQFQGLGGQVEVPLQVGSIDDGQHNVRARFARLPAEDQVHGHHLIGTAWCQTVGAGKVDQIEGLPLMGHLAFFGFDRDARVIADLLAQTGQGIEQSGLAGIGVSQQRDGDNGMSPAHRTRLQKYLGITHEPLGPGSAPAPCCGD